MYYPHIKAVNRIPNNDYVMSAFTQIFFLKKWFKTSQNLNCNRVRLHNETVFVDANLHSLCNKYAMFLKIIYSCGYGTI